MPHGCSFGQTFLSSVRIECRRHPPDRRGDPQRSEGPPRGRVLRLRRDHHRRLHGPRALRTSAHHLCTELEREGGVLTGRAAGRTLWGDGKRAAVADFAEAQGWSSPSATPTLFSPAGARTSQRRIAAVALGLRLSIAALARLTAHADRIAGSRRLCCARRPRIRAEPPPRRPGLEPAVRGGDSGEPGTRARRSGVHQCATPGRGTTGDPGRGGASGRWRIRRW